MCSIHLLCLYVSITNIQLMQKINRLYQLFTLLFGSIQISQFQQHEIAFPYLNMKYRIRRRHRRVNMWRNVIEKLLRAIKTCCGGKV